VRDLAERAYFRLCLGVGRLLRAARYSTAGIVEHDGERQVRKVRLFYAPLIVPLGDALLGLLDTGVRVLPQRAWEERERLLYRTILDASIRVDRGGTLVLPCLAGQTLATLLEDPAIAASSRKRAIELAVAALAELHARGFTHGDAMAENVMVDVERGVAHWFDFETVHDGSRAMAWRRADDVRALLATCVLRAGRPPIAGIVQLIIDGYGDDEITRRLAESFGSALRRPLAFHLGQAGLSFRDFREIARLVGEPVRDQLGVGMRP
jgi:hypothetical protein